MCRSVPQMEAERTRTSTSFGPIVGTGTVSSAAPRSARGFRNACIVAVVICVMPAQIGGQRMVAHGQSSPNLLRTGLTREAVGAFAPLPLFLRANVEPFGNRINS